MKGCSQLVSFTSSANLLFFVVVVIVVLILGVWDFWAFSTDLQASSHVYDILEAKAAPYSFRSVSACDFIGIRMSVGAATLGLSHTQGNKGFLQACPIGEQYVGEVVRVPISFSAFCGA